MQRKCEIDTLSKKVLLLHGQQIQHYRVGIYNYLKDYLATRRIDLHVASEGIQTYNGPAIDFEHEEFAFNFSNIRDFLVAKRPDAVIFWINPKDRVPMYPIYLVAKLLKIKIIHWGHRQPVPPMAAVKKVVFNLEHWLGDAVLLYAEHLRTNVWGCFQHKTFVANNTLNLTGYDPADISASEVKAKYGISTDRNIICMGRMQKRKRVDDLIQAFRRLNLESTGLVLVGPDSEGILKDVWEANIFKVGAVYGDASLDLLAACDVCCIPGHVGLSIADAFYCGLPLVTEDVKHAPEIMYLIDGVNGFMVPKGDIEQLCSKLKELLTNDALRQRFSQAARREILTHGHIDVMCRGFANAIEYVFR